MSPTVHAIKVKPTTAIIIFWCLLKNSINYLLRLLHFTIKMLKEQHTFSQEKAGKKTFITLNRSISIKSMFLLSLQTKSTENLLKQIAKKLKIIYYMRT